MEEPSQASRSKGRRILAKAGIAAVATLLTLLAAEAVTRLAGIGPPSTFVPEGAGRILKGSPVDRLPWVYIRDSSRTVELRRSPSSEPDRVTYTINEFGFRGGRAYAVEKSDGTMRIACLGDSFTFGTGIDDDETWPARLQESLERGSEGSFEVLNFGVEGYNTEHEAFLLESRVLEFEPDLVLLCYFINDAQPGQGDEWVQTVRTWRMGVRNFLASEENWFGFVREHSRLADVTAFAVYRRLGLAEVAEQRARVYVEDREPWRKSKKALEYARFLAERSGAGFAVVLYPMLVRRDGRLASHLAYDVVKRFLDGAGIYYIDLEGEFDDVSVEDLWVHPRNSHPNADANRLAAEGVARRLFEAGLVRR